MADGHSDKVDPGAAVAAAAVAAAILPLILLHRHLSLNLWLA